ncbi:MAG: hypothetical protein ABIP63_08440 [Thermoanaerobaculia bacterium]
MNQNSEEDIDIPEQTSAPGAVRGKYYERYMQGSNVVLLAPDVAEAFHDSKTVNSALRQYLAEHGTPPAKRVARHQE